MPDKDKFMYAAICFGYDARHDCRECDYYIRTNCVEYCDERRIVRDALELLKEQEAVEPKTGQWIYKRYDDMFMCSSCEKYSIRNDYPYCHWCGAKMEGR